MRRFADQLPASHVLNILYYIKMEKGILFADMCINADIAIFNRCSTLGDIVGNGSESSKELFSKTLLASETRGRTNSTISLENIDDVIELVDYHFNKRDYQKNTCNDPPNIQLLSVRIDMYNESGDELYELNVRMTGYEIICYTPLIEEFASCFVGAPLTVTHKPGFRDYKRTRI